MLWIKQFLKNFPVQLYNTCHNNIKRKQNCNDQTPQTPSSNQVMKAEVLLHMFLEKMNQIIHF